MPSSATERRSSSPRRMVGALALGLGLALAPGLGRAQNQPTSLLPTPPVIIVSPSAGASPASPTVEAQPAPGTAPGGAQIQVQQLPGLDVNGFGTMDATNGGLAPTLWAGTDAALADKLLAILKPSQSRPMQGLIRALLLSVATPPSLTQGSPAPTESLIARRARALWTLGRADDLAALLKALPAPAITPALRRVRADTALLVGDNANACAETQPLAAASASDPYPVELRVYCQFAAGQKSAAALGVDVLREQKIDDADFFTLSDALAGAVPLPKRAFAPNSPLILALARLANAEIGEPGADAAPMVLRTLALVTGASFDIRLAAAERAEAIGAIDTDTLRRLYVSVPFTDADIAGAEAKIAALPAGRAHALLYQAADKQTAALAKAGLIARALNGAEGPAFFVQARVYAAMIAAMQPAPDIALYAPFLARALLAAHQLDAARPWLGWIRAQAAADKSAAGSDAALAVLARIAQLVDAPLTADQIKAWRDAGGGLAADKAARRTDLALALPTALGDPVPADPWLARLDDAAPGSVQEPNVALALGFDAAVAAKRTGELVLEAYVMIGDGALTQIGPADLARLVAGLAGAGFKAEARQLAIDAALANGV